MSKYNTFRMTFEPTHKEARAMGERLSPVNQREKFSEKKTWEEFLEYLLDNNLRNAIADKKERSIIIVGLIAQGLWATQGYPTLFLESEDLANLLYECEIPDLLEDVTLPISSFPMVAIAVRNNTIIEDTQLKPFLMGRFPDDVTESELESVFDSSKDNFMVLSREGLWGSDHVFSRTQQSYEENVRSIGRDKEKIGISQIDIQFKIALSIGLYASSFPELIKDGAPMERSISKQQKKESRSMKKMATLNLDPRVANSPVSPHYRRGHYRILHDERYKRNSDGSKRIVFVSGSQVRGKSPVKTAYMD